MTDEQHTAILEQLIILQEQNIELKYYLMIAALMLMIGVGFYIGYKVANK